MSDHSPFSKSTVTSCTAVLAPETEQIYYLSQNLKKERKDICQLNEIVIKIAVSEKTRQLICHHFKVYIP